MATARTTETSTEDLIAQGTPLINALPPNIRGFYLNLYIYDRRTLMSELHQMQTEYVHNYELIVRMVEIRTELLHRLDQDIAHRRDRLRRLGGQPRRYLAERRTLIRMDRCAARITEIRDEMVIYRDHYSEVLVYRTEEVKQWNSIWDWFEAHTEPESHPTNVVTPAVDSDPEEEPIRLFREMAAIKANVANALRNVAEDMQELYIFEE